MSHVTFPKPVRGSYLLERKTAQKQHKAREQSIMAEAKRLDGGKCRRPRCRYKDMPVDSCHMRHRGMGGNPKEDRTTLETTISLCRIDHGLYDAGDLDIEPLTSAGTRGPCAFYARHQETGRMENVGVESRVGVSAVRGAA